MTASFLTLAQENYQTLLYVLNSGLLSPEEYESPALWDRLHSLYVDFDSESHSDEDVKNCILQLKKKVSKDHFSAWKKTPQNVSLLLIVGLTDLVTLTDLTEATCEEYPEEVSEYLQELPLINKAFSEKDIQDFLKARSYTELTVRYCVSSFSRFLNLLELSPGASASLVSRIIPYARFNDFVQTAVCQTCVSDFYRILEGLSQNEASTVECAFKAELENLPEVLRLELSGTKSDEKSVESSIEALCTNLLHSKAICDLTEPALRVIAYAIKANAVSADVSKEIVNLTKEADLPKVATRKREELRASIATASFHQAISLSPDLTNKTIIELGLTYSPSGKYALDIEELFKPASTEENMDAFAEVVAEFVAQHCALSDQDFDKLAAMKRLFSSKCVWVSSTQLVKRIWHKLVQSGFYEKTISKVLESMFGRGSYLYNLKAPESSNRNHAYTRVTIDRAVNTLARTSLASTHWFDFPGKGQVVSKWLDDLIKTHSGKHHSVLNSLKLHSFFTVISEALVFEDLALKPDVLQELKNTWNSCAEIKGSFDAKKYVSEKIVTLAFASKKAGKSLFAKTFEASQNNADLLGLPGLELNSAFEKGFAWGRYEKLCALAEIDPYAKSTNGTGYKRFITSLLCRFTDLTPEALNQRVLSQTRKKTVLGVKGLVDKIYKQVASDRNWYGASGYQKFLAEFELTKACLDKTAEIQAMFAKNPQALTNILYILQFICKTGGSLPSHPVLQKHMKECYELSNRFEDMEAFNSHEQYLALSLSRKVDFSVIQAAIKFAANPENRKTVNNIALDTIVLEEEGVKVSLLAPDDLRVLTIGEETDCCQYIGGYADRCARATFSHPDFSVMVVEYIDAKLTDKPLAQSAIWLSHNTVIIDSIEGLRKDAVSYSKITQAYARAIEFWFEKGLSVGVSNTSYGLTNQIRNRLCKYPGFKHSSMRRPALPLRGCYTDTDDYVVGLTATSK